MTTSERHDVHGVVDDHGAATYVPPTARWGRRRRRPTGAPPPLPRTIGSTGKFWLAASILLITWMVVTASLPRRSGKFPLQRFGRWVPPTS